MTPVERILRRVSQPPGQCWLWPGAHNNRRYGVIGVNGTNKYVHRLIDEHFHGPIPDGFHVDHLCRATLCVNPAHLEAVPPEVNRQRQAAVTEQRAMCRANLHALNAENTYVSPRGLRVCRTCRALNLQQKAA